MVSKLNIHGTSEIAKFPPSGTLHKSSPLDQQLHNIIKHNNLSV